MIKRIDKLDPRDLPALNTHCMRTIWSHFSAYGTEYDFCEFYRLWRQRTQIGYICSFNGSITAQLVYGKRATSDIIRELSEFVNFKRPYFVQLSEGLCPKAGFSGYKRVKRSFFTLPKPSGDEANTDGLILEPDVEYVYKTAFSGEDYGLWLTDTVRRKNKGQLRMFGYESSVLTVRFCIGGAAYISDVYTPQQDRNRGYATKLLKKTSALLSGEGYTSYLCADEQTSGFYLRMGCEPSGEDTAFKLKDKGK